MGSLAVLMEVSEALAAAAVAKCCPWLPAWRLGAKSGLAAGKAAGRAKPGAVAPSTPRGTNPARAV